MDLRKTTTAILLSGLLLASCSKNTGSNGTGSGMITDVVLSTGPAPALDSSSSDSFSFPMSESGSSSIIVSPQYDFSSSSSSSSSSFSSSSSSSSFSFFVSSSSVYVPVTYPVFSSSSSPSCPTCAQLQAPVATVPSWCVQRLGPNGEEILDPNDPAFDCSRQAPPPYSLCPQIQVEPYLGAEQPMPTVGNYGTSNAGTSWSNAQYLQGLQLYQSSSSSSYFYPSYSSSSASSPLGYAPAATSSGVIASGGGRLSLVDAFFSGELSCGKGVILGSTIIGGSTPFSACILKSPWRSFGTDLNTF